MTKEKKAAIADGVKDMEIQKLKELLDKVNGEKAVVVSAFEQLRDTLNEVVTSHRHEKRKLEERVLEAEKSLLREKKCSSSWYAELVRVRRFMGKAQKIGTVMSLVLLGLVFLSVACVFQNGLNWMVPMSLGLGNLTTLFLTIMIGGNVNG